MTDNLLMLLPYTVYLEFFVDEGYPNIFTFFVPCYMAMYEEFILPF